MRVVDVYKIRVTGGLWTTDDWIKLGWLKFTTRVKLAYLENPLADTWR